MKSHVARGLLVLASVAGLWAATVPLAAVAAEESGAAVASLHAVDAALPVRPEDFSADPSAALAAAVEAVDAEASAAAESLATAEPAAALDTAARLLESKRRVDARVDALLALRGAWAGVGDSPDARAAVRHYLRATTRMFDLSGRLRYLLIDGLTTARERLRGRPEYDALVARVIKYRSAAGAHVVAQDLAEAAEADGPAPGYDPRQAARLIQALTAVGQSGELELLGPVGALVARRPSPAVLLAAVAAVEQLGLPQSPRPDPIEELPPPTVTAASLRAALAGLSPSRLTAAQERQRQAWLAWLVDRERSGLAEDAYRLGRFDVRPGDWLLMRNPSPYNLFTDLSPGLFTHVGVVTDETGPDGVRRLVLVDLPERGDRIPATNVETYVLRTLHYTFLRHPDPAVARAMADAARDLIGCPSKFDLTFRTSRVTARQGQSLRGQPVNTYCAGFLLLCALQSPASRAEFFPLEEFPAGGKLLANFEKLGLSLGDDLISPTGALFSPRLELVGMREPMYDPRRQVEETVFDHFARRMVTGDLTPTPDLYQFLRLKLAEAASGNPLLAEALAKANNVSAEMDLVAAAKAGAVIEALDEIAFGASDEFEIAWEALRAGPRDELIAQGFTPEDLEGVDAYRQLHADLYGPYAAGRLSARDLRARLVAFYQDFGRRGVEARFFAPAK